MQFDTLVYADRSERAKLRVTGDQRAWFLDQVLSQSFDPFPAGQARDACMLTVHGRMTAYVEAIATDDSILIHAEPDLAESLHEQLSRYLFATMAEITDVAAGMGLVLVSGPSIDEALRNADVPLVRHPTAVLGVVAEYLWVERDRLDDLVVLLEKAGARLCGEDELEAVRIFNGVSRWGAEMNSKTFPQEAGIDERAVEYEKGCYLGQEAMAKIHFRGKVNRRKVRLEAGEPIEVGAEITLDGTKVGAVTSAHHGRAIALVRHTVEQGTKVRAGNVEAAVLD